MPPWIEYHNENLRIIVTADGWHFTINPVTKDHELFNLNEDPQERKNLAKLAEFKPKMEELLEKIKKWQITIDDNLEISL